MHILQVTLSYYPELQFGGPPQKIHALSTGLVGRGHGVDVVSTKSEAPLVSGHTTLDGVDVHYVPWLGRGTWRVPLDLRPLLHAIRDADVVHCYGLYTFLCPVAALLARVLSRPFILEPLGMYTPRSRRIRIKRFYHRIFTSWMAHSAAAVIATSPGEVRDLEPLALGDRLVLRPNGIDVSAFAHLPARDLFRSANDVAADERIVLYLGRISPIKNLEELILAFDDAHLHRTRLVLVGPSLEPAYASRLRALTAHRDLKDSVLMPGPLYGSKRLAALAAADLFVLPSLYESFGNAAAEAVAAGLPVLLTETCGIAPMIHGRAGLAVPVDRSALAVGLRTLLDDETERDRLTHARQQVLDELSWKQPLDQMEDLYRRVLPVGNPCGSQRGADSSSP